MIRYIDNEYLINFKIPRQHTLLRNNKFNASNQCKIRRYKIIIGQNKTVKISHKVTEDKNITKCMISSLTRRYVKGPIASTLSIANYISIYPVVSLEFRVKKRLAHSNRSVTVTFNLELKPYFQRHFPYKEHKCK